MKTYEQIKERELAKQRVSPDWILNNVVKPVCRLDTYTGSLNKFKCTIGRGEKEPHIRAKFELWLDFKKKGWPVLTELIFKNGKRADVLVINAHNGEVEIHEVLGSEKEKNIVENKLNEYPFKIISHKAEEVLQGNLEGKQW